MQAEDSNTAQRTHLFISYASEDSELASWLARKLAVEGYAVWFDRMKMLGGEPWVHDIDAAIKERSFRVIALLSQSSLKKPNPTKERTCAANVGKKLGISDFIIPLKLDSAEVDWQMTDITYLPFTRGWAEGWRQLLKKLDDINAPKSLVNGRGLAAATFDAGSDIVANQPETVFTNILPVETMADKVEHLVLDPAVYSTVKDKLRDEWAFFIVAANEAIAFGPPPKAFAHVVADNKATLLASKPNGLSPEIMRNGILALLESTIRVRLLKSGVKQHPKHWRTYYLPPNYKADGWLRFTGWHGKATRRKIAGRMTVYRPNKPTEEVHHHFAFEVRRWNLPDHRHAFQIRASLVFSDKQGQLITDKRVGPLRRKLTHHWWNDEWLNRLLAATSVIGEAPVMPRDGIALAKELMRVTAEKAIIEQKLVAFGTTNDDDDQSLNQETIHLDEEVEDEQEKEGNESTEDV